jgi:hypothetical protein
MIRNRGERHPGTSAPNSAAAVHRRFSASSITAERRGNLAPLFRRHVIRSAKHLASHRQRRITAIIAPRDFAHLGDT